MLQVTLVAEEAAAGMAVVEPTTTTLILMDVGEVEALDTFTLHQQLLTILLDVS